MSISPNLMMIQKFLPDGPTTSFMHYEVYRNKTSSEEAFRTIADTYARVMGEDKPLCDIAQQNLNAGVFVNGECTLWEKGPLFFQHTVRQVITDHAAREKAAGHKIEPARQRIVNNVMVSNADVELCASIACTAQNKILAW